MAKPPKYLPNGEPDGRGHAEGSFATRFGSGDGRHRPGRKKGSKSLARIYREVAKIPLILDTEGKKRKISTKEAIVLKQRDKAIKGDQRAAERMLDKLEALDPPEVNPDQTGMLLAEDAELLAGARARGRLGPAEADVDLGSKE